MVSHNFMLCDVVKKNDNTLSLRGCEDQISAIIISKLARYMMPALSSAMATSLSRRVCLCGRRGCGLYWILISEFGLNTKTQLQHSTHLLLLSLIASHIRFQKTLTQCNDEVPLATIAMQSSWLQSTRAATIFFHVFFVSLQLLGIIIIYGTVVNNFICKK